jgi:nucleoside-diphosphate-sugar epimerase
MNVSAPKILITGANGFVGSRLAARFAQGGYHVVAGVRQTADLSLLTGVTVEYRYGDVTHPESLTEMVKGVEYVIHNAGIVKAKTPDRFFHVNVKGTTNLLEAIVANNPQVRKIVYISSLAAVGPSLDGLPVRESDYPRPVSNYAKSKLAGEQAALSFANRLNLIAIRPPGVYGPGDTEIFSLFQSAHFHLKPSIGDQDRKLQLVHVDDLCRGIQIALEASTPSGEVYFISENRAYTMTELAQLLKAAVNRYAIPLPIPAPLFRLIAAATEMVMKLTGGTPMLTRDKADELLGSFQVETSKAKESLGFESQIPLAEGLATTYRWYLEKGWLK